MQTVFFRLLQVADKEAVLRAAVDATNIGAIAPEVFHVDQDSFRQVPGSPFAYWVSEKVRRMFRALPSFEEGARHTRVGLQTSDDLRFIRCWWEVAPSKLLNTRDGPDWRQAVVIFQEWCHKQTLQGKRWIPIAKGGTYPPFFDEPQMVVNWERDGEEMKRWTESLYDGTSWSRNIRNTDFYFRPGLTWPLRGSRLSAQAVPAGGCFSIAGKIAASDEADELFPLLGLMNSLPFDSCLRLSAGETRAQFEVGLIAKVPVPDRINDKDLDLLSREASRAAAFPSTFDECRHAFVLPSFVTSNGNTMAERCVIHRSHLAAAQSHLAEWQAQLDEAAFRLYGIGPDDRAAMEKRFLASHAETFDEGNTPNESETVPVRATTSDLQAVREMLSYSFGCVFGRWDIRFATVEKSPPELPDPFNPLPVCSPGMLQGADGLPLTTAPEGYPLRIDRDGILVDDPDHADDIIRRVRDVLEVIFDRSVVRCPLSVEEEEPGARDHVQRTSESIEREACEILGVSDLRGYFRKPGPGGFWDDHVTRYSKSRRKAPIYWLLQSAKKNYALWIYYPRLDKDILFKALLNYVEPKIRREESRLDEMRSQKTALGPAAKGAKKIDKEIERHDAFLSELRDFEDKLRMAANLRLYPDLNDGVVLNIAPLWELVPWKEAKAYWDDLMKGEYEWSSIGKQLREKGLVLC